MAGWENNRPNTPKVGTCTHVTQHCHGNSMETSRQTIHKHWLYLYILHFWFTSYRENNLLHGQILCWKPLVTFQTLPVNDVPVSHISLVCSKLKHLAPSFADYCHIVYILALKWIATPTGINCKMAVWSPSVFRGKFQHTMNCRVTAEFG